MKSNWQATIETIETIFELFADLFDFGAKYVKNWYSSFINIMIVFALCCIPLNIWFLILLANR